MLLRGCRLKTITDQDPCKSDLELFFVKVLMQIIFISMLIEEYQKNICHPVTFEKSRATCPFIENKASRLSYITVLLNKLPGEHIPLL